MTPLREPDGQRLLCTVSEACHLLAVGKTTLYSMLASQQIPSIKIGRSRRIPVSALTALSEGSALSERQIVDEDSANT